MKVSTTHLNLIRDMAEAYLARYGYTLDSITIGRDAWAVLHDSGAYRAIGGEFPNGHPDYSDAHLKTALASIMPNAVFTSKYAY